LRFIGAFDVKNRTFKRVFVEIRRDANSNESIRDQQYATIIVTMHVLDE